MSDSVAFDRAAEFYDASRNIGPEGTRRQTELLVPELEPRGRVLEVGVGTGQVSLPLHEAGIPMLGIDLSRPMMDRLVAKAGGAPPFPLVQGDATVMPFRDASVGAALVRWVLQLIPRWPKALAEMARVVRPGGAIVVSLGGYSKRSEAIRRRFADVSGVSVDPAGLGWGRLQELDAEAERQGLRTRTVGVILDREDEPMGVFLDRIERNQYSWTWPLDEDLRVRTVRAIRPWAEEHIGPLDQPTGDEVEIVWRAYDVPRDLAGGT